jgi:pyroglutamyl-peptidase
LRRASFDLEALLNRVRGDTEAALPVHISEDAGGYVCDWVYQHILAHGERLGIPAVFLHVPPSLEVPFEEQLPFVRSVVRALVSLPMATSPR